MRSAVTELPTIVSETHQAVIDLRALSVRALARMYLPDQCLFCHCIRRGSDGDRVEGVSRRYTAIALIGLATEPEAVIGAVLKDAGAATVCGRLLCDVDTVDNLGDAALTLWAAALHEHPQVDAALGRLRSLDPVRGQHSTVEIAWALTALTAKPHVVGDTDLASRVAKRLIRSFSESSGVFPHWPSGVPKPFLRGHVSCFADMVYPVQALSYFHRATSDEAAITAARCAGRHMVENQGEAGQWWWHFDVRSGRVLEGFPVYAVHQDSMAPMALFALQDACGLGSSEAIARGLKWLLSSPEIAGRSLIDSQADLIWRKVARHEPGKMARGMQAAASRVHPALRAPGVDALFRPGFIDYECRPYHLGWILHAFDPQRMKTWTGG